MSPDGKTLDRNSWFYDQTVDDKKKHARSYLSLMTWEGWVGLSGKAP